MLIKLAKLANHNPNEHEANSAARRVCQMLSEDNYKALDNALKIQAQPRDTYRGGTWNDVHRSTEPQWRSTRPPPKDRYRGEEYNPFSDFGFNTGVDWEKFWEENYTRRNEQRKAREREWKERQAQSWTWDGERSGDKGYKKVYTQKCRNCTVCGITRLTTDTEEPYVCYACKQKK